LISVGKYAKINLNGAKTGVHQRTDIKGEALAGHGDSLVTQDLNSIERN
jgi:hypothetical protein